MAQLSWILLCKRLLWPLTHSTLPASASGILELKTHTRLANHCNQKFCFKRKKLPVHVSSTDLVLAFVQEGLTAYFLQYTRMFHKTDHALDYNGAHLKGLEHSVVMSE